MKRITTLGLLLCSLAAMGQSTMQNFSLALRGDAEVPADLRLDPGLRRAV